MYHKGYRMKAKVSQIGTGMDALTQGHKIKQEPEGDLELWEIWIDLEAGFIQSLLVYLLRLGPSPQFT